MSLSFTEMLKRVSLNHDFRALELLGSRMERGGCSSPRLAGWLENSLVGHLKQAKGRPQYEAFNSLLFKDSAFGKIILNLWGSKFP